MTRAEAKAVAFLALRSRSAFLLPVDAMTVISGERLASDLGLRFMPKPVWPDQEGAAMCAKSLMVGFIPQVDDVLSLGHYELVELLRSVLPGDTTWLHSVSFWPSAGGRRAVVARIVRRRQ